ncbi:hypothetical protein E1162_11370 [Rhodobacteraceae bacterium RKSG542]|uniref:DNA polymerase beta superfamily protein n=1 Tax=Pseudovibrio flavus TaxID=2529854 RepID=UPI0012BCB278|nr:nucleotidyltransferase domain-containing protein [Pseudovibrio flavus]MTI17837.1 hypothetical protein [Pseudovibrio flavus]
MQRDHATREELRRRLAAVEQRKGLKVLAASDPGMLLGGERGAESFVSARFIFVRPIEEYLTLFPSDETEQVEASLACEAVGWDLKKVVIATLNGNPNPIDWVRCRPQVHGHPQFPDALLGFAQEFGDPVRTAQIYLKQLERHRQRFDGRPLKIVPEKLLMLLKPALSLRWYSQNKLHGFPPADLKGLLEEVFVRPVLRAEMEELVTGHYKGTLPEQLEVPKPILELLLQELEAGPALKSRSKRPFTPTIMKEADRFFLKWAVQNRSASKGG